MKKTLLTTTALVAAAASAHAVDVEMYGQVNKMLMMTDDGVDSDVSIADNDFSSTRFGMKGSQVLDNGLTASVLFEVEMQSNASNSLTQNSVAGQSSTPLSTGGTFAERHARVGLAGDFGAVFLGQTSYASDSVAEQDLTAARNVMGSDVEDIGGGIEFTTGGTTLTGTSVSEMVNNMDPSRADLIRYDSPIYNGFQARVSTAQGGDIDGAVYYRGQYAEIEVAAALGYFMNNDAATAGVSVDTQLSGSVSAKHSSGLGATVAYGQQDLNNAAVGQDDPEFYYVKAGYEWDNFGVAVDYGNYDNNDIAGLGATDHEMDTMGIGGQYDMGNGVSVSALYRQFDADIAGTSTDEIDVFALGARVKF